MIIKLENIKRTFNENINVLKGINIEFEMGKFYIIMGHSGNGKSTLLNILGLLDLGYTGDYYLNNIGQDMKYITVLAYKENLNGSSELVTEIKINLK